MAVKKILPKENLRAVDIRDTLIAHGADWSNVEGNKSANYLPNYFREEAKLAVWQRDRPRNIDVPYNDYDFFRKTINRRYYTTGGVIPSRSFYTVIKDDGLFDLGQFRGYSPNKHGYVTNIGDLPSTLSGNTSYFVPTRPVGGFDAFISYITKNALNSKWSTSMLLVCERDGYEDRYFLLQQREYPSFVDRLGCSLNIFSSVSLNKIMRDIDISKYRCHLIGVAIPEEHPYFSSIMTPYQEVPKGVEFDLLPSCVYVEGHRVETAIAVKNNVSISTPHGANELVFMVYDTGDMRDYFIPDEEVFRYAIYYDDNLKVGSSSTEWRDLEGVVHKDLFLFGLGTRKVNIEIEVPKKSIPVGQHGQVGICELGVGNYDSFKDDGLSFTFYWERIVNEDIGEPIIECKLGITYFFDSDR